MNFLWACATCCWSVFPIDLMWGFYLDLQDNRARFLEIMTWGKKKALKKTNHASTAVLGFLWRWDAHRTACFWCWCGSLFVRVFLFIMRRSCTLLCMNTFCGCVLLIHTGKVVHSPAPLDMQVRSPYQTKQLETQCFVQGYFIKNSCFCHQRTAQMEVFVINRNPKLNFCYSTKGLYSSSPSAPSDRLPLHFSVKCHSRFNCSSSGHWPGISLCGDGQLMLTLWMMPAAWRCLIPHSIW